MFQENFVYAVFKNEADFNEAFSCIEATDLNDVLVVRNAKTPVKSVAASIQYPLERYLILGGVAGALIGGIAGAIASPTLHDALIFQVLTPIMAAVSGAALGAYFGVWIGGFLRGVERPELQPDVFEATVHKGAWLLGVTTHNVNERRAAIDALNTGNFVELLIRNEVLNLEEAQSISIRPSITEVLPVLSEVQRVA